MRKDGMLIAPLQKAGNVENVGFDVQSEGGGNFWNGDGCDERNQNDYKNQLDDCERLT